MTNFNEIKEKAKEIALDCEKIERLYIEQLESSNMLENVEEFNILYISNGNIDYEYILEISEKFGNVSAMFEEKNDFEIEGYKIIYSDLIQGKLRFLNSENKSVINKLNEKYICVLNKNQENDVDLLLNYDIEKIKEDDFLTNSCEFFWNALTFAKKLSKRELFNITFEYRKMLELIDIHLKHFILSENKYVLDLGKDDKFIFNYLETALSEKYLYSYSNLDITNLWNALFSMCILFRKISLKIAVNLRFEYTKELDRDTLEYIRVLKSKN